MTWFNLTVCFVVFFRLMTPWLMLPDENEVCVRFSYHMWGRTMGNLYMWLENPTDDARDCMWAKRGATDTNTWKTTNESCEVKSSTFRVGILFYTKMLSVHLVNIIITCSAVILYADWSISVRPGAVHTS